MKQPITSKGVDELTDVQTRTRPTFTDESGFDARLAAVKKAGNPLLEAARTLLRAQADIPDLPEETSHDTAIGLRELLVSEVQLFDRLCTQANIRRDHVIGARYCLCTALDEAVMQSAWGRDVRIAGEWAGQNLASTFLEDSKGGAKIYLLVARLMEEPDEHRDLLQVIYRVLSLGFEGQYRGMTRQHSAVRQRIYNEIMRGREPVPQALSPNWKPHEQARRMSFFEFPVWITVAVLSIILLGLFGYFKYELATRSAAVQKQIIDIGRMIPPPASSPLHLKDLLKSEVATGTIMVNDDAHRSVVIFRGDAMFQPGDASIKPAMGSLLAKIAGEIVKVPGKVVVAGYSDNVPIRSRRFASNQALSEERATQVMQMLQAAGVPASRLEAVGKGDAAPIGDNSTVQGRAQNRRVEIVVAR
ncbi:type VI secretion system protein TssL, long form [Burkholderia sp. BCC0419]|uniref:type VI secretion system protein TssL, long form n=1 Tax=Burkholderia sp. BCC0419 TaxID=486878 RepID=UPI00158C6A75|nr:type VI secretion system protein TssL, long form [Burkholderia sp. BCC0419]